MEILRKLVLSDAVRSELQLSKLDTDQGFVLDSVVLKKLLQESVDDQNEFVKEARMLYNLQYENVVSFKAFCQTAFYLLDYVQFVLSLGFEFSRHPEGLRDLSFRDTPFIQFSGNFNSYFKQASQSD